MREWFTHVRTLRSVSEDNTQELKGLINGSAVCGGEKIISWN